MRELKSQLDSDQADIQSQFDMVDCKLNAVTTDLTLSLKDSLDRQSKDLMSSFSKMINCQKGGITPIWP